MSIARMLSASSSPKIASLSRLRNGASSIPMLPPLKPPRMPRLRSTNSLWNTRDTALGPTESRISSLSRTEAASVVKGMPALGREAAVLVLVE
jgi:hypothetical protein